MLLEGKVAIVTGAARGLGRVEAVELARHGARVVINDLGTRSDGGGKDEGPARAVVDEIKSMGGEAVAHFGDVADWNDARSLVGLAVERFGSLDILVNNAGFCRDKMIFNMTEDEFDSVIRVHVKGHFCTMRFASEYWRNRSKEAGDAGYGRIINTSSEAFIFGSPGQPNYAAAKAGIVAMTMCAAQTLAKYGVTANVIMPRARTRMNDSGILAAMFAKPAEGFDTFAPENVAPLVAFLASPRAGSVNGYVMIVWGKEIIMVDKPGTDTKFQNDAPWTIDAVERKLVPYVAGREPIFGGFTVKPA